MDIGSNISIPELRDYNGNMHGGAGSNVEDQYKYQGEADLNGDGIIEKIFTNAVSGRWASLEVDPVTGQTSFDDFGEGGGTRIIGIYEDPLVLSGEVEAGGPFDSQTRFQNDLQIDNLSLAATGDFDGDEIFEVYWRLNDGSAFLRSLQHDDGNIRYANYQSLSQMTEYLNGNGNSELISAIIG